MTQNFVLFLSLCRSQKVAERKQYIYYFQRPVAIGRRKHTRGSRHRGACTFAQPIISRKQMSMHREAAAHCRVIARNQHLFAYTVTLAAKLVNMSAIQCQHWTYVL
jgi:hypothetical protein